MIAAAGCAAGMAVGFVVMKALISLAPANMPLIETVAWDWRVFAVAAGVATVTAAVFGLAPAWQASRARPADSLRHTARMTAGGAQARWRSAFAVAEVALSLILLVGAGLLLKSFVVLMGIDLGFRPERVLAMNIPLPAARYADKAQRLHFFERLEERVRALPGVESVAFANRLPMRGGWGSSVALEHQPNARHEADFQAISPGYFETLGIPLLRGRTLTAHDREGQPSVAIVNQTFVRLYLNGMDPIGRRVLRSGAPWFEIVGVVNDIRRGGKAAEISPQVYLSAAQTALYPVQLADLAVRSAGDPRALSQHHPVRSMGARRGPARHHVRTLEEIITASVAQRRFQMLLLIVFAAVAVVLAMIRDLWRAFLFCFTAHVGARHPHRSRRAAGRDPRSGVAAGRCGDCARDRRRTLRGLGVDRLPGELIVPGEGARLANVCRLGRGAGACRAERCSSSLPGAAPASTRSGAEVRVGGGRPDRPLRRWRAATEAVDERVEPPNPTPGPLAQRSTAENVRSPGTESVVD